MPRFEAKGQVLQTATGYSARVRVAPGPNGRPSFPLAARSEAAAEERTKVLAGIAKRLRGPASRNELEELLTAAGDARTPNALADALKVADMLEAGETERVTSALAPTFEAFAKEWTSGDLRKKHPDHVREKDATRDLQVLRDYINPEIGPTHLPDVTLEHAERVMAKLPPELAPRSRKIVAQCMSKVLSLAVYPGRHIARNPIPREWMPKVPRSANKAKAYLYPEEDAKLLSCNAVDLERRIAYGVLAREGMRASELALLRWRDVDLKHGRVRLDENKTDDPRAWALSPDVVRALAWWKKKWGGEESDLVIRFDLANAVWWLRGAPDWKADDGPKGRGDLRTAGVTRPELFERSKARQPLRVHDLRATFVTVSLANGKSEQWVTDRTGHRSSAMLALYTRQARTWSELGLGELRPLDALLPEMRKARRPAPPPLDKHWTSGSSSGAIPGAPVARSAGFSAVPEKQRAVPPLAKPSYVGSNPIRTSGDLPEDSHRDRPHERAEHAARWASTPRPGDRAAARDAGRARRRRRNRRPGSPPPGAPAPRVPLSLLRGAEGRDRRAGPGGRRRRAAAGHSA